MPDLLIHPAPPAGDPGPAWILAPWLAALPRDGRDLLALLPVADVNGAGFRGLRALAGDPPSAAIAAIFCADPFLRMHDAVQILRAAGICRVTNFPTIQIVDGTAARGFDSAGLGMQREAEILGQFVREGFEATGFATSAEGGAMLARQGVSALVLHPGPAAADWRARAAAGHRMTQALRSLRHLTGLPLRLMRPDGYGPELEAAQALADGGVCYG